ncbi:BREX system Lon protease-like protein BrxL [Nibrella viscosa]|uniref:BREX system Lon protease-like protein BrxL n=1 Tax=Nibrella viscosa TaxID=1084524 RepID=A0ABP8K1A2_9BACT
MDYSNKVKTFFGGKVVRKDLTAQVKGSAVVPTYVLEYLLGQYCASDDDATVAEGIERIRDILKSNFVHRSDAEYVKSLVRERGQHRIIDKISVLLNDKQNQYEADFANLMIRDVPIADRIVTQHRKLLSGAGVWCIIDLTYDHARDAKVRWGIETVKPIQVSGIDLEEYINARAYFSTEEWLDLLMHSVGYEPSHFSRRDKLIQLSRLIPFVENNYNFIELGPKGTGKSHVFSELSPHGVLVSGGDVSKATLFVNNSTKQLGLLGFWDVVALDEFEQEKNSRTTDADLVKILQNYMANQSFNRGNETIMATASMAFVGNTKHTVPYMLKNSHLFESIPQTYLKGAFLDRMHLYIPGWEVRILKENVFSRGHGFIVDYLAEILRELRRFDYSELLTPYADLDATLTQRDKLAIRKTFSGLAKLLYPHRQFTPEEAEELIEFAVEGRRRVKEQLYRIDETFAQQPAQFRYIFKPTGQEKDVETLEKLNLNGSTPEGGAGESGSESGAIAGAEPAKPTLFIGDREFKENQTGVSYRKLFGDYLRGATQITLIDPYIRSHHQFRQLMEFCVLLHELKPLEQEIELEVQTWIDTDKEKDPQKELEKTQAIFDQITESVAELGIRLTVQFDASIHDRFIYTSNGWKIRLGMGLDIYQKPDLYDVANVLPEKRKCRKKFEISYGRL